MEEPSQQQHKRKEPKGGTSAWAVQQAKAAAAKVAAGKRAVNWKAEAQVYQYEQQGGAQSLRGKH
eukprot:12289619-Alexandrium_andersonii.AAC.1